MLQGAEALVKDVTALGRWPLDIKNNPTERILIRRIRELRDAHASGALQSALDGAAQPTVIAQLEDLQRKFLQETADRMLGEAEEAVDPMLAFADEAHNRIEQELLILAFGNRTKSMLRRLKLYKDFVQDPTTNETEFTKRYGDRILHLERQASGCTYIPGDEVAGDELRSFSDKPILSGPLVCQLCKADFTNENTFALHKKNDHGGEHEYRKRVLYLMAEAGPRPITAQEKRIIVQNFARFQQYCRPCAGGNFFADCEEVPRAEAACVVCAQKDYLEHRYKLCLFGEAPAESTTEGRLLQVDQEDDDEEDETAERHSQHNLGLPWSTLVKRNGVYYIQSPEKVQAFMRVERYHTRWPLIPEEQLHASSIQHPRYSQVGSSSGVSLAFGMALEADPPQVLVRSVANPRSLPSFVLGNIYNKFALWT